jgi:hypothetical protein
VIFKILRNALDAPDKGKVCIVGRNPDAIWFDDYEDRVIRGRGAGSDSQLIVDCSLREN